ncbi:radical SAM protein [Leptolyngbya valderiana BDU 20041]|nr:radical SAM protein [Geitlerinema sp. CS-897]OAB61696.1 radical SAM protein [Leptolyngbya valderiana BDU 20041]
MRVGILEVMALPSQSWTEKLHHTVLTKQYASLTPQAISVWCRQLGHQSFYATYYGVGNPERLLPKDLDIVFFSCCTLASSLVYGLAKLYRQLGTFTIIGGAHAEAFPADCLRFFDLVVKDCNKELISDIVSGQFEKGHYISSAKPFTDCPTVEERMPEILTASFFKKKWPSVFTSVPMVTSLGCPYTCDFCMDWNSPYQVLSSDRFANDLHYLAKNYPNTVVAFHDPNFAIQFDRVFNVLESIPPESRMSYVMECSLSILTPSRIDRLRETKCIGASYGVESWQDDYSTKAGLKFKKGFEKVDRVSNHVEQLYEYVAYQQVTLLFGLDTDKGDEPVELMKRFIEQTPSAWPVIGIPVPFGGTPMFDRFWADDRILKSMPFTFYYFPHLVTQLKHYDAITYYEKLIELSDSVASEKLMKKRLKTSKNNRTRLIHIVRQKGEAVVKKYYLEILNLLRTDKQFRDFHDGKSTALPNFYKQKSNKILGRYAELVSPEEQTPCLEQIQPQVV